MKKKKREKGTKNRRDKQKTCNKMVELYTTMSVITLNVDDVL